MKRWIIATLAYLILPIMSLPVLGRQEQTEVVRIEDSSITIPADTVFRLRLNQGLNSRQARPGDTFTARVTAPVAVGGVVAVPEGSTVHGRVTTVTRAERRRNGTLGVTFYKLELPSGQTFQIYGSLTSLAGGEKRDVSQEGEVKGKSTTKRDVVFIGGGAGVGAIIGAIAGGGKGAAIGAVLGAGAGTAGALLTKGNEVDVRPGTEIGMVLDKELTVPVRR